MAVNDKAIDIEDIYKQVLAFDQREIIRDTEAAKANFSSSTTAPIDSNEQLKDMIGKLVADQVALLSSGNQNRPKAGNQSSTLLHDKNNHPNDPTELEKTWTCRKCNKKGHSGRTCTVNKNKRQRSSAEDDTTTATFANAEPQSNIAYGLMSHAHSNCSCTDAPQFPGKTNVRFIADTGCSQTMMRSSC